VISTRFPHLFLLLSALFVLALVVTLVFPLLSLLPLLYRCQLVF
jgi:hypothetical protein